MSEISSYDLMNANYTTDKSTKKAVIHLFARDPTKVLHDFAVSSFTPYFFSPSPESSIKDLFGRGIERHEAFHPSEVKALRQGYEWHDEADILFEMRFLIDRKIFCGFTKTPEGTLVPSGNNNVPMFINLFDCEVESPPEIMARPMNPKWPIVSLQSSNTYNDEIDVLMLDTKLDGDEIPRPPWAKNSVNCITRPVSFEIRKVDKPPQKITVHPRVFIYNNERLMINDYAARASHYKFDGHSGYNAGGSGALSGFDWPYIIRRGTLLGAHITPFSPFGVVECHLKKDPETGKNRLDPRIKGVQLIDMMVAYQKWSGGRQGAKLVIKGKDFAQTFDFHLVMERECGFYYVDLGDKVADSRINHPEDWLEYCTGDAFALALLEREKGIIRDFDTLRRLVGVPLEWAFHNSRLIDTRLLRVSSLPLPTKRHGKKERVTGALVYLPRKGMKYNVAIIDTKTLYPMLIDVYNLSPEMLVRKEDIFARKISEKDCVKIGPMEDGSVYYFRKSPKGILAKAVRYDMDGREKYREMLKTIKASSSDYDKAKVLETKYKFLACSYYGVTGYEGFRLASKEVRKCITFLGREANRENRNACASQGYPTVYGDTDSLFLQLSSSFPNEGRIVEDIVNRNLRKIAWKHGAYFTLEAKFETFCKRILFVPKVSKIRKKRPWLHLGEMVASKKRYTYIDEKDDLYVVGMAPRRSSTPVIVRRNMLEWISLVMRDQNIDGAIKLVQKLWDDLPTFPLNVVGVPKGLHKDRYDVRNPWRDGCEFMKAKYGKVFREDKKPLLIYLKDPRPGRPGSKKHRKFSEVSEKNTRLSKELCSPVACITETDASLPPEEQSRIDWIKMREKVIAAHFRPMFEALDISWDRVIYGHEQLGLSVWQ